MQRNEIKTKKDEEEIENEKGEKVNDRVEYSVHDGKQRKHVWCIVHAHAELR
jgi:hypothetical protein